MTSQRWQRVHEALQACLEVEPSQREDVLESLGLDRALHLEVLGLLHAGDTPGRFDALVEQLAVPPPTNTPLPERIGVYRPLRVLGCGGMGTVFLAQRDDGSYEQQVAIKVLPFGTRADLHGRFLIERQILASLPHPNIARLLDGGATDEGRPYLVMEYADGEPITTFCDRRQLRLEDRLTLFLEACVAVAYAHAHLIVHRDIKPSNVLVVPGGGSPDDEPHVKLLDFGIARMLDGDRIGADVPSTRADLRVMTPEFAAPEQVRGDPITTATDIYQLGGLLYELLAGQRPLASDGPLLRDVERTICFQEPAPPSTAVLHPRVHGTGRNGQPEAIARARGTEPNTLHRALAGDLDTIVLRALSKEPARRYSSVEALGADIGRHLEGRPVLARPDTWRYRARKFVWRHGRAVAAAAAATLVLVTAAGHSAMNARHAALERDRAERAAELVIELFEELEPLQLPTEAILAVEMLGRAVARVRAELPDEPLMQARLLDALGRVYQARGYFAEAEPLLREALGLRLAGLGPDHLEVAQSRHVLANLFIETARPAEAEAQLRQVAAAYRRLDRADPRVAAMLTDVALARRDAGDAETAEALLEQAVALLRGYAAPPPEDLSTAVLYLGKVRVERGDPESAQPLLGESLRIRRERYGNTHPTVANALDGVGESLSARGDHIGAERVYREALAVRRQLFPDNHSDIGVSFLNIGVALHEQGRIAEAAVLLRDALAVLRPALGEEHVLVRTAIAYLDSNHADQ
jgi:eukaryotic-like serine/threonine-protein kinase